MNRERFAEILQSVTPWIETLGFQDLASLYPLHCFYMNKVVPFGWIKVKSEEDLLFRHLIDSLLPFLVCPELLDSVTRLVDVGSGPGLPLFPILHCFSGVEGLAIERRQGMEKVYLASQTEFPHLHISYVIQSLKQFKEIQITHKKTVVVSRATLSVRDFFREFKKSSLFGYPLLLYKGPHYLQEEGIEAYLDQFSVFDCELPDRHKRFYLYFKGYC